MASYFLRVRTLGRKNGTRVTRAAAYRAGERIHDERSSDVFDFCSRQDVVHKEIVLASEFAHRADMQWARNRETLWNASEHAGTRCNSMLAREVLVLLPPELTHEQRAKLVRGFSQELANRYRIAVDFVVHTPKPGADPRHHHAHLLMTSRELRPDGLGPRSNLELSGTERRDRGLGPSKDDYLQIRERWAQVSNEALRTAGLDARIDHRSFEKQGVDREPAAVMPQKAYYAEKKSGISTQAGDEIRARHRERVEARLKGPDELARVREKQRNEDRRRSMDASRQRDGPPTKTARSSLTREELNQKRRERQHANAEALNHKRRDRYKQNAEVERRKYREWRQANAAEVNEKRRQWRMENADHVNERARKYRNEHAADISAKRWAKFREKQLADEKLAPVLEQTSRKGASLSSVGPDADESARNWLAFRLQQKNAESSLSATDGRARNGALEVSRDDEKDRDKSHQRNNDLGL